MSKPEINQEALSALSLADLVAARTYVIQKIKSEQDNDWVRDYQLISSLENERDVFNKEIVKRFANIFIYGIHDRG